MVRTPRHDLERELQDQEFVKLYGAEQAKSEFAVTLARARGRARVTQKELANRLGRTQPYIAKLERGDANPTLGTVGSLLAVLDLRLAMHLDPLLSSPAAPMMPLGPVAAADASASLRYDQGSVSYGSGTGLAFEDEVINRFVGATS